MDESSKPGDSTASKTTYQIIAVVVVIIIIVAAVAVYFVYFTDDDDDSNDSDNDTKSVGEAELTLLSSDVNPVLQVYGNVNEDMVIDDDDVKLLEQVIADGTYSNYQFADANFDGVVNEDDVAYIEKIISATYENPVEVKHINRYTNGDYWAYSMVPTNSIASTGSANLIMMMMYAGINEEIKAISYSGLIDETLYADYQYLFCDYGSTFDGFTGSYQYRTGSSAGYFSEELLVNHINKDGITAIITADNASSYLSGASSSHTYGITEEEAEALGLDVIRVASAATDPNDYLADLALLSFVMGKDPTMIQDLAAWYEKVIVDLNSTLEAHVGVDTEQVRFAVSSSTSYSVSSDGTVDSYNYVSSNTSDYTAVCLAAGGYFAMEGYDFGTSSSSSKYTDLGRWLIDYDIDKIIVIKTGSDFSWYGGTALTDGLNTLQSCCLAFSDSEPYYNNEVYVISGDMPILLRTVYAAVVMYPSLFSDSWAENYNVEHCTNFLGLSASTVRGGYYYVSMADLGLSGH